MRRLNTYETYWNKFYYESLKKIVKFHVEQDCQVLSVGPIAAEILDAASPARGVVLSSDLTYIPRAKRKYKKFAFKRLDIKNNAFNDKFEYILAVDTIAVLDDIQNTLSILHNLSYTRTRLILTHHNFLWEPILVMAGFLGLITKRIDQNWLSGKDVENLLNLADFEVVKSEMFLFLPIYIPVISALFNKILANLPILKNLCLARLLIARPKPQTNNIPRYSVSVIVPVRNEEKNIFGVIKRTPEMGTHTEIIFVEGGSKDNTRAEILKQMKNFEGQKDLRFVPQDKEDGKGGAVRLGFEAAKGEVLMILDGDLAVRPEDLPKFYNALAAGKGELIMGNRLVYKLERDSMRFLNILGNKFFSSVFTWILSQPVKDTLCGTKVLFKRDYLRIAANRKFFGQIDPFGDFDLIFGATKLSLKIVEIPVRYQARVYGKTNISRFKHGWLLLQMSFLAFLKIKLRQ